MNSDEYAATPLTTLCPTDGPQAGVGRLSYCGLFDRRARIWSVSSTVREPSVPGVLVYPTTDGTVEHADAEHCRVECDVRWDGDRKARTQPVEHGERRGRLPEAAPEPPHDRDAPESRPDDVGAQQNLAEADKRELGWAEPTDVVGEPVVL